MLEALKVILQIQEFDMKMIRLMRLKEERQKELDHVNSLKNDLHKQVKVKEDGIFSLKKNIRDNDLIVIEFAEKVKQLESHQNAVKKVEEFNALSREIAATERQKLNKEHQGNDFTEKFTTEEEELDTLKESIKASEENSKVYEKEILEGIDHINKEGRELKIKRDALKVEADPEVLVIYDRLLCNKKDRVVVPIENRTCSGCHIVLTAQHENLVRKGERLVFCEHCARIHYWQESEAFEGTVVATKHRRRVTKSA